MVRAHLLISGIVQGVGYRYHCRREAIRLGLTGWVRNLDDGRVEAVAQGPREQVEALIQWCHHGPSSARVSGVEAAYQDPGDDFQDFGVR